MNKFTGFAEVYISKLMKVLNELDSASVDNAIALVEAAWRKNKQIITLGNGGSSLTALHFINDWNKSVYMHAKLPFRGRSLVDNIGLVMSYGNDVAFQDVFIEQLRNILLPGDLVIAISGSGNSENVIRAVNYANENGAVTLGLCGFDGGQLKDISQHYVWIKAKDMQLSEDVHFIFGHIVMQSLCVTPER
jgi:D-sedoheptulose 7-phosphate isomerase